MTENNIADLKDIYRLQRKIDALRDQMYTAKDSAEFEKALKVLVPAETEIAKAAPPAPPRDAAEPGEMKHETPDGSIEVRVQMPYVPTSIVHLLPSRTYGNSDVEAALVSYRLTGPKAGQGSVRYRLTSVVEGYSALAIDTIEIASGCAPVDKHQFPTFYPDRVRTVTELTRAALRVRVEIIDGGVEKLERETTFPIWLLARNTAYLAQEDSSGKVTPFSSWLGAFVTPSAHAVLMALREAADLHVDHKLRGYMTSEPSVEPQVKAIYDALHKLKITYINSFNSFGAPVKFTQRVRLPREVLKERAANCVDGMLLVASLLEAATLNAGLVLVPGHTLVAWQKTQGGDWDYLETTMIGSSTFEEALERGRRVVAHYAKQPPASADAIPSFTLLSIEDLRCKGIYPME